MEENKETEIESRPFNRDVSYICDECKKTVYPIQVYTIDSTRRYYYECDCGHHFNVWRESDEFYEKANHKLRRNKEM